MTGAASQGRVITDIDATLDRATGDFVPGSIMVNNRIVTQEVPKAADMTALMAEYNVFAAPIANVIVGNVTAGMDRMSERRVSNRRSAGSSPTRSSRPVTTRSLRS